MKKFAIIALSLSAMFALTACGAKTEAPAAATTAEASAADQKVGEVEDAEGKSVATVKFEAGKPVSVELDYINKDGSSKYEQAKAGQYVMAENSTPWNEQVDTLEKFLAENNFDVTKVNLTDADGHTDAVTGVSIKVPDLLKAVEEALK